MSNFKKVEIPRYVPEGVRNYNGIILETNSLNEMLTKYINSGQCYAYNYRPSEEHTKKPGGFYTSDCMDIIGLVISYDKENISVNLNDDIEFKNPVALITTVGVMEEDNTYRISGLVRIEIVEEESLEKPRIQLENN